MSNIPMARAHQADATQGTEKTHTLIIQVNDRPGAIDRVVGVIRRRRSMLQSLSSGPSHKPDVMRVTAKVKDAEVVVEHLIEQLRKIVDVQDVVNLTDHYAITREMALIQIEKTSIENSTLSELGQHYGAILVDETTETLTFEVSGSLEQVEQALIALQPYGIRDVARSGCIAIARVVRGE